jgi:hypothetical protein
MGEKPFSHFGKKRNERTKKIGRIGNEGGESQSYKEHDSSIPYKIKKLGVEEQRRRVEWKRDGVQDLRGDPD